MTLAVSKLARGFDNFTVGALSFADREFVPGEKTRSGLGKIVCPGQYSKENKQ
jgi:hypothetical protein